jgi:peptidyl-prolyl cis-trans isomerase D
VLARKDMIDAKVADVAFGLKKDELSKPVEGQFKVVLVRVSDIVPGKQRTYEEVKNEIRDRLAEERASQEIQTLHEKVESERSAGKSLKEIGESLKLPFNEIAETDRAGKTALASRRSSTPRPRRWRRQRSPAPRASRPKPPTSATAAMSGSMCWASRRRSRRALRR